MRLIANAGDLKTLSRPPPSSFSPFLLPTPPFSPLSKNNQIVATTPEACALLRAAAVSCPKVSLIGALLLPGLSLSGNTLFFAPSSSPSSSSSLSGSSPPPPPPPLPAPSDRVCAVLAVGGGEQEGENAASKTILVLCQYESVPEERAFGLAAALCERIDAGETLVLSSLPSHLIPGSAGAEEGAPPLSRLQTSAALAWARRAREKTGGSPWARGEIRALPPGAAAAGFPAAVIGRAAAQRRPALLLVRADARAGAPAASELAALASGAVAAVSASSSAADAASESFAAALGKAAAAGAAAAAAAAAADAADAASARAAVYA